MTEPLHEITMTNSSREVLRITEDGSIYWRGERLTEAKSVGLALRQFIQAHRFGEGDEWKGSHER